MTRQIWREWTVDVLSISTVNPIIIFSNRVECTNFIKFLYKLNWTWKHVQGTQVRFLRNAPTQIRPPDSKLLPHTHTQTHTDATIGAAIAPFAFLSTRVATVRTYFQFFFLVAGRKLSVILAVDTAVCSLARYQQIPFRYCMSCV
jgi:hypothetical protein